MKRVIGSVIGLVLVAGFAQASSQPTFPTAMRISDGTTWSGTAANPLNFVLVGEVVGITNPVAVNTTLADEMTVVQKSGNPFTVIIDAGTVTRIIDDVGIKDNGNSITVDSPQLPTVLDADGFLKVHEQGTANVRLMSNIDTPLGKVKITDGTDVLGVLADGSINVNLLTDVATGIAKSGFYTASVAAGATVNLGTYTVSAGTKLYLNSFGLVAKGDTLCLLKINAAVKSALATTAVANTADRYLGDTYEILSAAVLTAEVTNNESVAVTVYFSWSGKEITN